MEQPPLLLNNKKELIVTQMMINLEDHLEFMATMVIYQNYQTIKQALMIRK
jgi:hypothetical protein